MPERLYPAPELDPVNIPQPDAQTEPSALDLLEIWLQGKGIHEERAITTIETLQSFFSTALQPAFDNEELSVGLTAVLEKDGTSDVWISVLPNRDLQLHSLADSTLVNDLQRTFTSSAALPILPNPSLHLDFWDNGYLRRNNTTFPDALSIAARDFGADLIGIIKLSASPSINPESL